MEKSIEVYERLGYQIVSKITDDYVQNNRILFMKNVDDSQLIELIEPMGQASSVYNLPEGYHHICYKVDITENFLSEFKNKRIGKIFTKPISAPAFGGEKIVFAYLKNGVFVEFLF